MDARVYLDHAATTPLDPRVIEAMVPCLTAAWGNPSSIYAEARDARRYLDAARRSVGEVLGARAAEIVFTSGGSESDNLAVRGLAEASKDRGTHVVTSATEHHAVIHAAMALERDGFRLTYLPVDAEGFVDPADLEAAICADTVLVSIMTANNETGTVQPLSDLVRAVKSRNSATLFHTDAVQAAGMIDLDVGQSGVDALSLTAHKCYGPKGAGALYVRQGTRLQAQVLGGTQERERRAGTENVAGAVGLATALRLAEEEQAERRLHATALRDYLLDEVPARIASTILTGPADRSRRLPNNFSCCFEGLDSETLLQQLDLAGFAASSGSACTSGSLEASHVLTAMGIASETARGSLRLTVGTGNSMDQMHALLSHLPRFVQRLRGLRGDVRDAEVVRT